MAKENYTYEDAGYSRFFRRSIDNPRTPVTSLADYARSAQQTQRAINFDQQPISGAMADITRIGKKVVIDGIRGKISVNDDNNNEVVTLGNTDGQG